MVGVPGFEPGASWTRRFGSNLKRRFPTRLVLRTPAKIVFPTSPLQCLRPLPAWSGSAFGSKYWYSLHNVIFASPLNIKKAGGSRCSQCRGGRICTYSTGYGTAANTRPAPAAADQADGQDPSPSYLGYLLSGRPPYCSEYAAPAPYAAGFQSF